MIPLHVASLRALTAPVKQRLLPLPLPRPLLARRSLHSHSHSSPSPPLLHASPHPRPHPYTHPYTWSSASVTRCLSTNHNHSPGSGSGDVSAKDKDKDKDDKVPKKGMFGKIKDLWKDYGYKAVLCYASLYFLNLGGLAIALETDVLHLHDFGYDAPAVLDMICGKYEELTGRKELGIIIHENPRYGIFAIALFLNDFFEPLRIGGTIFILSRMSKIKRVN